MYGGAVFVGGRHLRGSVRATHVDILVGGYGGRQILYQISSFRHILWNIDGCALSLLFQTCEKHIILACYDFWQKTRGYEPGALVHDGMHIKSDEEWLER